MSLKRYDGASWVDAKDVKRFDGGSWVDAQEVKRFDGASWLTAWAGKRFTLYRDGNTAGSLSKYNDGCVITATNSDIMYGKYGVILSVPVAVGDTIEVIYDQLSGSIGDSQNKWNFEGYAGGLRFLNIKVTVSVSTIRTYTVTNAGPLYIVLNFIGDPLGTINPATARILSVKVNGVLMPFGV